MMKFGLLFSSYLVLRCNFYLNYVNFAILMENYKAFLYSKVAINCAFRSVLNGMTKLGSNVNGFMFMMYQCCLRKSI